MIVEAPPRDLKAIATLANGQPAYSANRLRITQSAIDAGDKAALARLAELTGRGR